ncbi:UDP-N-acetyl-D-mannosamine dehydrogenase [Candidatus Thioglobus sp.]|nr:UDP-N-acetyl-D-mannosamine dehydrogenase [Candidatus Thioglobus sp.]
MIISIIGLGYIGLPTAAILASSKVSVIGVDVNEKVVDTINKGEIHIIEPELEALVHSAVQNGNLRATTQPEKSDVFMLAVPTPFKANYKPDLSYIESACRAIAPVLEKGNLVILESTSPVGTTEKMIDWLSAECSDLSFPEFGNNKFSADISIAHCPERVLPGNVVRELRENVRIIGGVTSHCAERASNLYKLFVDTECLITDCRTAELSKLVENSFRDVNIAFANELSLICDKLDINVWELIKLANHHPRVNILKPGPGVGGHCIAVDPWFIVDSAKDETKLIRTARLINDSKPSFILDKVNQAILEMGEKISEISITCLGLSFKPNIDDLRQSPALEIAKKISLMSLKKLYLVEPNIFSMPNCFEYDNDIELVNLEFAVNSSDIVILLVDHNEFNQINLDLLSDKYVIDTRGIWS